MCRNSQTLDSLQKKRSEYHTTGHLPSGNNLSLWHAIVHRSFQVSVNSCSLTDLCSLSPCLEKSARICPLSLWAFFARTSQNPLPLFLRFYHGSLRGSVSSGQVINSQRELSYAAKSRANRALLRGRPQVW